MTKSISRIMLSVLVAALTLSSCKDKNEQPIKRLTSLTNEMEIVATNCSYSDIDRYQSQFDATMNSIDTKSLNDQQLNTLLGLSSRFRYAMQRAEFAAEERRITSEYDKGLRSGKEKRLFEDRIGR